MRELSPSAIQQHAAAALAEDVGAGDATTEALIDASQTGSARIMAREPVTVSGLELARAVFRQIDAKADFEKTCEDGAEIPAGGTVLKIRARLRALLTGERTALNFLQRLSGIATQAACYIEAVHGTSVTILDTRKTTPGWRALEKYAVQCGGAQNHRFGLDDLVMIKDNHLAALPRDRPLAELVQQARAASPGLKIEVEAETVEQAVATAEAGADIVLLDNMSIDEIQKAVKEINGRAQTEASGRITLENIRAIAETGVDFISVGALTHSARAVDLVMETES
jgi:nicotinate-nucleotide pyrophosphorylase (carboxylating)